MNNHNKSTNPCALFLWEITLNEILNRDSRSIVDSTKDHGERLQLNEKFNEIQIITKLSLREKLESCFVFPSMIMIVWINGLIYKVYLGDKLYKELVQLISTTHGLYLQKF